MKNNIKILVVDYNEIIYVGIKMMLHDSIDIENIHYGCSEEECFDKLSKTIYDILIIDDHFPDIDIEHVVRQILYIYPNQKILMLNLNTNSKVGNLYIKMGAKGYMSKTASNTALIRAVKEIMDGKVYHA